MRKFVAGRDVAANSGRSSHPDWFLNLEATPTALVEIMNRTLRVRAEELSDEEAVAFWPCVLRILPDYARYPRRTSRRIPLVRLVPAGAGSLYLASDSRMDRCSRLRVAEWNRKRRGEENGSCASPRGCANQSREEER